MAIATTTLLAIGSLAVAGAGLVQGMEARKDAKEAQDQSLSLQRKAQGEQEKIQGEQRAQNAAQAAAERRTQIREERVRRARIMQSSENTGVSGSSGEFGALGALGVNLATNVGTNAGRVAAGGRISEYAQNASGFMSAAQDKGVQANNFMQDAAMGDQLFSLGGSIFSSAGGFGALKSGYNQMMTPTVGASAYGHGAWT
jgi:hypothetical protein